MHLVCLVWDSCIERSPGAGCFRENWLENVHFIRIRELQVFFFLASLFHRQKKIQLESKKMYCQFFSQNSKKLNLSRNVWAIFTCIKKFKLRFSS